MMNDQINIQSNGSNGSNAPDQGFFAFAGNALLGGASYLSAHVAPFIPTPVSMAATVVAAPFQIIHAEITRGDGYQSLLTGTVGWVLGQRAADVLSYTVDGVRWVSIEAYNHSPSLLQLGSTTLERMQTVYEASSNVVGQVIESENQPNALVNATQDTARASLATGESSGSTAETAQREVDEFVLVDLPDVPSGSESMAAINIVPIEAAPSTMPGWLSWFGSWLSTPATGPAQQVQTDGEEVSQNLEQAELEKPDDSAAFEPIQSGHGAGGPRDPGPDGSGGSSGSGGANSGGQQPTPPGHHQNPVSPEAGSTGSSGAASQHSVKHGLQADYSDFDAMGALIPFSGMNTEMLVDDHDFDGALWDYQAGGLGLLEIALPFIPAAVGLVGSAMLGGFTSWEVNKIHVDTAAFC